MDEEDVIGVDNFHVKIGDEDRLSYTYNTPYLLKISELITPEIKPSMDFNLAMMAKIRDHHFSLLEMVFYEIKFGGDFDSYGPVACASSSPCNDEDSFMVFEKRAGKIMIYSLSKISDKKMVWPVLSQPVAINKPIRGRQ
jgi:hypothetical protein